jgi:hypothetical protein
MGYSSVKLYKDMVKALRPAKTIRTKVTPVSSAPATGWQAADRVTKKALELYLQSQKEEKEKQDISARMQMFRDYNKPQAEFDPSKYGQTPDQLRDTGYKTVNYATTGEGDFGGDNVYDGDEPLSRDPEEAKAWQTLYKEEADKTQNRFDKENPYGMDLVNKNNYNSVDTNSSLDRFFGMEKDKVEGPQTSEMRMALMGDSIGRRDAETERLRVIDAAAKKRNQTLGDAERGYGRKRLTAKNLAAAQANAAEKLAENKLAIAQAKLTDGSTSNIRDFAELQRLKLKFPPDENGKDSREVATFRDFVRATKVMNLGDRYQPYDPSQGQSSSIGLPPKRYQKGKTIVTLPSVPATGQGANDRTDSATVSRDGVKPATVSRDGVKIAQLPVTDKQLAAEINSEVRPMVEARRTGQLALDLMDANKDNIIPVSGTFSRIINWNSDSDQGILKSYIENLKSPNVLGAMMSLKAASPTGSTGFGQLNIKELDILINRLGALNVNETNVKVLRRSIVSINNSFDSVVNMVKKNVPEEKLKEIGLHKLFYGESDSKKLKKNPNVSAAPPEITTDAQYKALPSGTKYIGPDGKERTKL